MRGIPLHRLLGDGLNVCAGGGAQGQKQILAEFIRSNREDDTELCNAFADQPVFGQIAHFAHRMKGASKMLGAQSLASAAEAIEEAAHGKDQSGVELAYEKLSRELHLREAYIDQRSMDLN